jgi:hypothetical protein
MSGAFTQLTFGIPEKVDAWNVGGQTWKWGRPPVLYLAGATGIVESAFSGPAVDYAQRMELAHLVDSRAGDVAFSDTSMFLH